MTAKYHPTTRVSWYFAIALSVVSLLRFQNDALIPMVHATEIEGTCTWSGCNNEERDPALKEFTYDVGDGPQTTLVYVEPELNSFYRNGNEDLSTEPEKSYSRVTPNFSGLGGKFINMSNKMLDFYWEDKKGGSARLMTHYPPFSTDGTGTFPSHRFFLTESGEPDKRLNLWIVKKFPNNVHIYDPYKVEGDPEQTERNLQEHLNENERRQYDQWRKTISYAEQYKAFTGRTYLANYGASGPRAAPMHRMWRAEYFGQQHWVTTRETHFVDLPPIEELGEVTDVGASRVLKESDPVHFREYRARDENTGEPLEVMNMTLTVMSCVPRVFEIRNFMSQQEVNHILYLAGGISLKHSRTGDGGETDIDQSKSTTRTSKNSWVKREKSPIIDAIYRRAADLARIDEALLRARSEGERSDVKEYKSLAETLQLVHYDVSQQYTAHHDFGYAHIEDDTQPARFATILFYLNEGMVGGHTSFPRWVNGETFHELKVKPELGKAILFYDQLPDGNLDDFSQHSAKPIIDGEKWLINLWIWDPTYK